MVEAGSASDPDTGSGVESGCMGSNRRRDDEDIAAWRVQEKMGA
jgi:hypothetical protein